MKAAIFDMDGVLIDTPKILRDSFNSVLKEKYGFELDKSYEKSVISLSLKDQIKNWKNDFNLKEDIDPIKFSKLVFEEEKKLFKKLLEPNKDLIDLINELKNKNLKLAVATSSTKERAFEILKLLKIIDYFDLVITAEDVVKHKPDPEIYLEAAKRLGVNKKDCVVIEDSFSGVMAASNAGMKVIVLKTDFYSKEDFNDKEDLFVNDFSQLSVKKIEELFN